MVEDSDEASPHLPGCVHSPGLGTWQHFPNYGALFSFSFLSLNQDEELLNRIQSTIINVQEDCEKLNTITGNLIEEHRQKQKDIDVSGGPGQRGRYQRGLLSVMSFSHAHVEVRLFLVLLILMIHPHRQAVGSECP